MESEILTKMQRRLIQQFLSELILLKLREDSLSGYDIISLVHHKFRMLLSAGTVYSCLYSLEREGLVKGSFVSRSRVYSLTDQGKEYIKVFLNVKNKVWSIAMNLFS